MCARRTKLLILIVVAGTLAACNTTPALFPPEGVDHLSMTVKVDVDIAGIGKDSVELKGAVTVHRSGPTGPDGKSMTGFLTGASLHGKSGVFGDVYAVQSPVQPSPCEYTYESAGRYRGHFDINGWFWLPEHKLLVKSSAPVHVEGVASGIPPVGQKAETTVKDVPLEDIRKPGENPIGVLSRASAEIHEALKLKTGT
jgi:hypothetical protein